MEKPDADTVAYFEGALPDDPRAVRGQMFGHPCAFVNGNMFFGTFGQSVILRVGEARAAEVTRPPLRPFVPKDDGRAWKEYVQVDAGAVPGDDLAALAREALDFTAGLPPKEKKKPAARKKRG